MNPWLISNYFCFHSFILRRGFGAQLYQCTFLHGIFNLPSSVLSLPFRMICLLAYIRGSIFVVSINYKLLTCIGDMLLSCHSSLQVCSHYFSLHLFHALLIRRRAVEPAFQYHRIGKGEIVVVVAIFASPVIQAVFSESFGSVVHWSLNRRQRIAQVKFKHVD